MSYGQRGVGAAAVDKVGQGPDVLYTPPRSAYRIVFWTYRKRVLLIAAGRAGVERYIEFCA